MRLSFRTALGIALFVPSMAFAQAIGNTAPFTISINPQYPTPYGQVTLTPLSSTINLANSTMAVSVGGKNIYTGGAQPVQVSLGGTGSITNIKVTMTTNGKSTSQTLSVQPQDISLIVEPLSSAPPLYAGKPLVPLSGSSRIVAIANMKGSSGKNIDPTTLSYQWTVDDTKLSSSSGIGKMAINVASPLQYRSRSISVAVESQDGTLTGGADVTLISAAPSVRVYENDSLLGILFDHALSNSFAISGAESTLFAAPFSFPVTSGAPTVQWFLAGTSAQTGNSITLRPTGNGQGNASLSLIASFGDAVKATTNLSLSFGTKNTNIFGL